MKRRLLYYGAWSAVLLLTEIIIFFSHWHFIRAYIGDVLVIPLMYCMIRMSTKKLPRLMPFLMCCIGFVAEGLQYIRFYELLGFDRNSLVAILIGTSFSWWDVLCYIVGMVLIYLVIWVKRCICSQKGK